MADQATTTEGDAGKGGEGDAAAAAAAGGAGGEAKSWLESLPDDIRDNSILKRYATPEDGARALISATGRLGVPPEELIRLPKPDDAKGVEALWNKVGRPEKVDGYGDVKLPDGSPMDKDALQGFLATMHQTGPFTPAQAQAAAKWYGDFGAAQVKAATDAFAAAKAEGERALKGEWGAAYQQNLDAAALAAERFGGKDFRAFVDESGMGDDPRFLKTFKAIADAMGEAGAPPHERGRDGGARNGVLAPAEAQAERARMEADPKIMKALMDPSDPHHEHQVQRRLELIRLSEQKKEN